MQTRHESRGKYDSVEKAVQDLGLAKPGAQTSEPWWSQKSTDKIDTIGHVIGFTFKGDKEHETSWRLDYDPDQGIHLNLGDNRMVQLEDLTDKQGRYAACIEEKVESHYMSFRNHAHGPMPNDILRALKAHAIVASGMRGQLRAQGQLGKYSEWAAQKNNRLHARALARLELLGYPPPTPPQ
eukprot:TRINITY_DN230_c0_g1_i1.p1 TRINITY_DN230_c0_g1~~TRINITY_DN230_c0_g1_i1.p1  ORF type:complete len:182 (+),score=5.91 TRINITY_DN230_c0_g1_i1:52-597(+)